VDSVKSRITNLSTINPNISHNLLCRTLIQTFQEYYRGADCEIKELNLDDLNQNQKVGGVYNQLVSWEWLYQKTPEFTNNIETRFDWGIIDVFFKVTDGNMQLLIYNFRENY
jgi:lipoate-protein ligase A